MTRPTPFVPGPAENAATILLILGFVVASTFVSHIGPAADFQAVWLAGRFLAEGRPDLIYPHDTSVFTMSPPQEWVDRLSAEHYSGGIYPFIYPPIWAWLAAVATRVMTFDTLINCVAVINPVLMLIMLMAARRLAAPKMRLSIYLGLSSLVLLLTPVGLLALYQSQPQILVACLTVAAIERAEHGAPKLGGALLAVAAAIKLYPAFYALFLLVSGNRSAAASFALVGGALGAASLALLGWQPHAAFLHMIGVISDTALVTRQSFAAESLIAQLCCTDQLQLIKAAATDPVAAKGLGWHVMVKPPLFSMLFNLAQVGALIGLTFLFHRSRARPDARAALWPCGFALLSLLGPIAWSYHFLAPLAFAPIFLVRFRPVFALTGLLLFTLATVSVGTHLFAGLLARMHLVQFAGTLSMTGLMLAYFLAAGRADRRADGTPSA